ncbi:MAG: tetratricopeptide repeat protein [Chloroflexi bacterium]|nr:tetratricopeptide repeat protein [Chloroflexota bacterium]
MITLTALVNKALLRCDPVNGRYEVHELLRQYAEQKLTPDEKQATRDAHSSYYLNLLHQRQRDLEGGRQLEALREIGSDIENVRDSLFLYHYISKQWVQGGVLFDQAIRVLQTIPSRPEHEMLRTPLLIRQAFLRSQHAQYQAVKTMVEACQAGLQPSSDPREWALLAMTRANMEGNRQKQQEERPFCEQALMWYRQAEDCWGISLALLGLAASYLQWSDNQTHPDVGQAKSLLREALTIQEVQGDVFHMSHTYRMLAIIARMQRDYDEAERLTRRVMGYLQQLGITNMAGDLNNLGTIAMDRGQFAQARQYFEECRTIDHEQGVIPGLLVVLGNLAQSAFLQGDFTSARLYAQQAQTLSEQADPHCYLLGWIAWAEGEYDQAVAFFNILDKSIDESDNWRYAPAVSQIALIQGRMQEARQRLEASLPLAEDRGDSLVAVQCRIEMGKLAYVEGDYTRARECLQTALSFLQSSRAQAVLFEADEKTTTLDALVALADVERAAKDYERAHQHLLDALHITDIFPAVPLMLAILAAMADLLDAQSQPERATELAAFIRDNPKAFAVDRTRAAALLDVLREQMPPESFTAACERGRALDLETVVRRSLDEPYPG